MPAMSHGWKIASIVAVCFVAALIVARFTISAFYNARAEEEIRLFKAEGGSLNLADMAPRAEKEEHLILLDQECLPYVQALRSSQVLNASRLTDTERKEIDDIAQAISDFEVWDGLHAAPTLAPEDEQNGWNDNWLPLLEKHLERSREAFEKVRTVLASDNVAFSVDWSKGRDVNLLHLSRCRSVVRLLGMDAVVRARKGDAAAAFDDIRLSFRMRRLFDRDPVLISELVGMSTDGIACSYLQGVLRFADPDRESFDALLAEIGEPEKRSQLTHVLLGETAGGLGIFKDVATDYRVLEALQSPSPNASPAPLTLWDRFKWMGFRTVWLSSVDRCNYLAGMREIRAQSRLPLPQMLAAPQVAPPVPGPLATRYVSNVLGLAIRPMMQQEATAAARLATARAALACALYRAETGSNPASLDALVPAYLPTTPADPRTGAPLAYDPTSNSGFVDSSVHSTGATASTK
jgi:hypothetical protein